MNTFIIYFDKGGNLERRYMQNTINIAKELVDAINNIGIEKNKTNLYIFDNNNMIKKVDKIKIAIKIISIIIPISIPPL